MRLKKEARVFLVKCDLKKETLSQPL